MVSSISSKNECIINRSTKKIAVKTGVRNIQTARTAIKIENYIKKSKGDEYLIFAFSGQLSTPMSVTYNATLELTDVMIELFRIKRYYNNFTHLKYDFFFFLIFRKLLLT